MTELEYAELKYNELEDFLDACFKRAPNLPFTQLSHKTQRAYDRWQELKAKENKEDGRETAINRHSEP